MWKLLKTNSAREWVADGTYETVTAAARRIRDIEGNTEGGIFFRMLVEIDYGSDEEAFGHLEATGKKALYVVKRSVN